MNRYPDGNPGYIAPTNPLMQGGAPADIGDGQPSEEELAAEEEQSNNPTETRKEEPPENALSDLFEAPGDGDSEMQTDDLTDMDPDYAMGGSDGLDDILGLSSEDVMGKKSVPKRPITRSSRRGSPPAGMGGLLR